MPSQDPYVRLAHLLRPQGRKGELLAELLTDFPERFGERQGLALRSVGGTLTPAIVESHWLPVGRNAGRVVLKLQGTDTIAAAELHAGSDLVVPPEHRVALATEDEDGDTDAQYIADLLDCTVYDRGEPVGFVEDVQFPATTTGTRLEDAAPLLVVRSPSGAEQLIPFAKAWIDAIDIPAKRLMMRLPEGLLDLND